MTARRYGSTCMGAFLLAETGLCDGRRATTHWRWARALAERRPQARVEADRLFIAQDALWTSAGATSGIDMTLAMVEADMGRGAALDVARANVVDHRRAGDQAQMSSRLRVQMEDENEGFEALHAWIFDDLRADLSAERLAERQGMSLRNFARVCSRGMGCSPGTAVERLRVDAARTRLAREAANAASVAREVGFGPYAPCVGRSCGPRARRRARFRGAAMARLGAEPSGGAARTALCHAARARRDDRDRPASAPAAARLKGRPAGKGMDVDGSGSSARVRSDRVWPSRR